MPTGAAGESAGTAVLVHNSSGCLITSLINRDDRLVKEAQIAGRSVQSGLDSLTAQLAAGSKNPGIGSKHLFGKVFEARARDGARVYFRNADGGVQILGKSNKANQDRVIRILRDLYE